ncbi:FAD-dependent monooxygenase [Nocardia sp. NPDC051570]|uniref:FAD-dependent monooxygenase n=1 Tax=Nocardia sp. NPDC051570 TaxID=3364324 RepID=UPI0037A990D0
MNSTDVIVVGAGPVGMTVAALLHRARLSIRILDARPDRVGQLRAAVIHPRTLEILESLPADPAVTGGASLAARMVDTGIPRPSAHFASLPDHLPYGNLDTSYPFVLTLTQPETERLLDEHLAAAGVVVETGWEVTGLEQNDDGVTVTGAGGRRARARYVVGADGAHSAVRKSAGIDFPGTDSTGVGFLADVRLDRPPTTTHHWDVERGWYSVVPLTDGVHRLFGMEPGDSNLTPERARIRQTEDFGEAELRALLWRLTGDDLGLREILRTARLGNATRHADRYRAGRVFLAGDAAHVHLPAAGQGMNVGMQDAANLAWKLAAEASGRAPASIIDGPRSFDAERRPIAARLASNTLAQGALMTTFTPGNAALRELMSNLIARDGDTADELRGWVSGLDIAYAPAGIGPQGAPAGRRVPNLPLTTGETLHRALHPDQFALIALDSTAIPIPHHERVIPLRSIRGWEGRAAVLVRPDGYAAAAWHGEELADTAAVSDVIAEWTGAQQNSYL